jgi:hypothetical protein
MKNIFCKKIKKWRRIYFNELNFSITNNEILQALRNLKNGKSVGLDSIPKVHCFIIYISMIYPGDIQDQPSLDNNTIPILLYADDSLIISLSKEGLQHSFDRLPKYCTKWKIYINLKKTKILQFNRNGRP